MRGAVADGLHALEVVVGGLEAPVAPSPGAEAHEVDEGAERGESPLYRGAPFLPNHSVVPTDCIDKLSIEFPAGYCRNTPQLGATENVQQHPPVKEWG